MLIVKQLEKLLQSVQKSSYQTQRVLKTYARALSVRRSTSPAKAIIYRSTHLIDSSRGHSTSTKIPNITLTTPIASLGDAKNDIAPVKPLKHLSPCVGTYPSPYEYVLLSSVVYSGNAESLKELTDRGWHKIRELHRGTDHEVWCHHGSQQVVVNYQGTVITNIEHLLFDYLAIMQEEMHKRVVNSLSVLKTDEMLSELITKGYRLSFTGHSLGGFMAELAVCACRRGDLGLSYSRASAVVFDSPGSLSYLNKHFSSNIEAYNTADHAKLNIISFLSHVNLVNTFSKHPGVVFHLKPELPGQKLYLLEAHSLKAIKKCFDTNTGVPREYIAMTDWPLASFKEWKPNLMLPVRVFRGLFSFIFSQQTGPSDFFNQIAGDQYRRYFVLRNADNSSKIALELEKALYAHYQESKPHLHPIMLDEEVFNFIKHYCNELSSEEKAYVKKKLPTYLSMPSSVENTSVEFKYWECSNPFYIRNELTQIAYHQLEEGIMFFEYVIEFLRKKRDEAKKDQVKIKEHIAELQKNPLIDPTIRDSKLSEANAKLEKVTQKIIDLRIAIGDGAGSNFKGPVAYEGSETEEVSEQTLKAVYHLQEKQLNSHASSSTSIDARIGFGKGAGSNHYGPVTIYRKKKAESSEKALESAADHEKTFFNSSKKI